MKINKISAKDIDKSYDILVELKEKGYDTIKFKSGPGSCEVCQAAESKYPNPMKIEDYLNNLSYDAPIAEITHPDDKSCYLIVYKEDINEEEFQDLLKEIINENPETIKRYLSKYLLNPLGGVSFKNVDYLSLYSDLLNRNLDFEVENFLIQKIDEIIKNKFPTKKIFYDGTIQNL